MISLLLLLLLLSFSLLLLLTLLSLFSQQAVLPNNIGSTPSVRPDSSSYGDANYLARL